MARIAVDFDGVIFDKAKGTLMPGCVRALRKMAEGKNEITVFTNRPDYDYSTVKAILDANYIPYDRIICGKPSYDLFIDDRVARFEGWDKDYL